MIQIEREYPVYPGNDLQSMIRKHVIDEVHFAVESDRLPSLEDVLLACDDEGVMQPHYAVDFFPHVNSQIALETYHWRNSLCLTFSAAPDR